MRIEMNEKCREIMGRKEDTGYLGRNLFLQGDKFVKDMRDHHPHDRLLKAEATRMLMKDSAKRRTRTSTQQPPSEEVSDILSTSNSTLNTSVSACLDAQSRLQALASEAEKEKRMKGMIRNKSFESVLGEQRRQAAWEGFSNNWAMGFYKNEDVISTKKRRRNKRSPRKYAHLSQTSTSLLDYNDIFTRHTSLKKYKEAFNTTASAYALRAS